MKNLILIYLFLFCVPLGAQDVEATIAHESQNGASDGSITLQINGGFAPYSFSWTGPNNYTSMDQDIYGLTPGQYFVTVTDGLCGTAVLSARVLDCNPILGANTGLICPYTTGFFELYLRGEGPFVLSWSDNSTETVNENSGFSVHKRSNLVPGVYSVTVTNAAGCSESITKFIVSTIQPIEISGNVESPSCFSNTGSISLSITGGKSPYKYSWADGSTSKDRTGLAPGIYCVTVSDRGNCTKSQCFTINPFTNQIKIETNDIHMISICEETRNSCDGKIDITVTGGSAPYNYRWVQPDLTEIQGLQDLHNLCKVGTYSLIATDMNGCSATKSFSICCCGFDPPDQGGELKCGFPNLSIQGSSSNATNTQGGAINITIIGGNGNSSLVWKKNNLIYSYQEDLNRVC